MLTLQQPSIPPLAVAGRLIEINSKVPAILTLRKQPEPLSCPGGGKVFLDLTTADLGFVAGVRGQGEDRIARIARGQWGGAGGVSIRREGASRGFKASQSAHCLFHQQSVLM